MRCLRERIIKTGTTVFMGMVISLFFIIDAFALPIVAGDDTFPSVGEIEITTLPNPFSIPVFNETIHLDSMGTFATVHRDEQVGDTIDTEIVSLDLFGTSTNVGPMHVRVGTGNAVPVTAGPSLGQILNVLQDPSDPGYPIGAPSSFLSGDSFFDVFFEIDDIQDQSGGVGCDEDLRSSVACLVKKQFENSQIPKEGLQPPELDKKPGKDWLAAKVEGEPGTYYLGVQIRDRLGNVRNLPIERFQLIPPKPVPPPPSPEPKTHTLIVKVYVESKRLSVYSPEKLQLVIDPKDTEPGPPRDKYIYEFKDLKRGQKYTVTGKYEETSGIRFKAEGKISHTFQKGDNEEYKIKLTLKRQ